MDTFCLNYAIFPFNLTEEEKKVILSFIPTKSVL